MTDTADLQEALESKSLTRLTKAISKIAEKLGYQLRPPHTDIVSLTAKEEADEYVVHFEVRLQLHYSANNDGLVFTIGFGGDALAETPTPLLHELFYAAVVREFHIYGYGSKWAGKTTPTPREFTENLEVTSHTISEIELGDFGSALGSVLERES